MSQPGDPLVPQAFPELFIGLVGPVGTDLDLVKSVLEEELTKLSYKSEEVRVSSLLRSIPKYSKLPNSPEDKRLDSHMTAGTEIRETITRGDALALLSVLDIRAIRERHTGSPDKPAETGLAYIIRSFKHPKEVQTLRDIYGPNFLVISAYAPKPERVKSLSRKIAESRSDANFRKYQTKAEYLINRDEEEEGKKLGQDVTDAFPMGDFFLVVESKNQVKKNITRFLELLFGYPFHTPSKEEVGMFYAHSASMRSADLSRQVGASITNDEGDIIAIGCNEVPMAGGGQYWPGTNRDYRDFQKGYDSSTVNKRRMLEEIVDRFAKGGLLGNQDENVDPKQIAESLLTGQNIQTLAGAQILNLLEFGRVVHAEMAAICDSARRGTKIRHCVLYTTTFPCHLCAKHIIASGISRVVYIEPYPKSQAQELYEDSMIIDEYRKGRDRTSANASHEKAGDGLVKFEPFHGVAPRRYIDFFTMPERKNESGEAAQWKPKNASPRIKSLLISYLALEVQISGFVSELFDRANIGPIS